MDGTNPFSYPRLVQPVLDKHCVACHAKPESKAPSWPRLDRVPTGWHPAVLRLLPDAGVSSASTTTSAMRGREPTIPNCGRIQNSTRPSPASLGRARRDCTTSSRRDTTTCACRARPCTGSPSGSTPARCSTASTRKRGRRLNSGEKSSDRRWNRITDSGQHESVEKRGLAPWR